MMKHISTGFNYENKLTFSLEVPFFPNLHSAISSGCLFFPGAIFFGDIFSGAIFSGDILSYTHAPYRLKPYNLPTVFYAYQPCLSTEEVGKIQYKLILYLSHK